MVVVVDDAMLREHFDFSGRIVFRFDLKELAVPLICGGVNSVDLLDWLRFSVYEVVGSRYFAPALAIN